LQPKVAHYYRIVAAVSGRPADRPHGACHALSRSVSRSDWKVWRPSWPLKLEESTQNRELSRLALLSASGETGVWGICDCHALSRCVTLLSLSHRVLSLSHRELSLSHRVLSLSHRELSLSHRGLEPTTFRSNPRPFGSESGV